MKFGYIKMKGIDCSIYIRLSDIIQSNQPSHRIKHLVNANSLSTWQGVDPLWNLGQIGSRVTGLQHIFRSGEHAEGMSIYHNTWGRFVFLCDSACRVFYCDKHLNKYLSMLGLKLIHLSKRGPWYPGKTGMEIATALIRTWQSTWNNRHFADDIFRCIFSILQHNIYVGQYTTRFGIFITR